jgi:16S rRNA (adenine1518-N6/adenine1519-N6)-dimethyltransferase
MRRPAPAARPPRRRRFGQHFLHDPAVIRRIVTALDARPGDHLVEIGPGHGALTRELLALEDCTLDAIEIDRDLVRELRPAFGDPPRHVLHAADALEFDFAQLARARRGALRIVGNLPYNISTPLLFHLAESVAVITDIHVMLQREVAQRIAAQPGEADYGRLTAMLAPHLRVTRLFDLGPGAFQPPPQVRSAVVRLVVRPAPLFAVSPHYARVVAAAFAQRRKTLRNALAELLTRDEISACGQDPGARPETVTPEGYNTLAQALDRTPVRG